MCLRILKFYGNKSSEGLSVSSLTVEQAGMTGILAYSYRQSYPFSTYGESIIIVFQNFILFAMTFYYRNQLNFITVFAIITGYPFFFCFILFFYFFFDLFFFVFLVFFFFFIPRHC